MMPRSGRSVTWRKVVELMVLAAVIDAVGIVPRLHLSPAGDPGLAVEELIEVVVVVDELPTQPPDATHRRIEMHHRRRGAVHSRGNNIIRHNPKNCLREHHVDIELRTEGRSAVCAEREQIIRAAVVFPPIHIDTLHRRFRSNRMPQSASRLRRIS